MCLTLPPVEFNFLKKLICLNKLSILFLTFLSTCQFYLNINFQLQVVSIKAAMLQRTLHTKKQPTANHILIVYKYVPMVINSSHLTELIFVKNNGVSNKPTEQTVITQ